MSSHEISKSRTFAEWQMCEFSAIHAQRNEVKRSMLSRNFEIYLNNPLNVNLYLQTIYIISAKVVKSLAI